MARQIRVNVDDDVEKHLATKENATSYIQELIREDMDFRAKVIKRLYDLEDRIEELADLITPPVKFKAKQVGFGKDPTSRGKAAHPAMAARKEKEKPKVARPSKKAQAKSKTAKKPASSPKRK